MKGMQVGKGTFCACAFLPTSTTLSNDLSQSGHQKLSVAAPSLMRSCIAPDPFITTPSRRSSSLIPRTLAHGGQTNIFPPRSIRFCIISPMGGSSGLGRAWWPRPFVPHTTADDVSAQRGLAGMVCGVWAGCELAAGILRLASCDGGPCCLCGGGDFSRSTTRRG